MNDEFYIGWQAKAPRQAARIARCTAFGLLCAAAAAAALIGFSQRLIGRSVFEWGKVREFTGVLHAHPVPHLEVARGQTNKFFYLVNPWKHGFDPGLALNLDGQPVALRGTLIFRDDQAMIEVERGSVVSRLRGGERNQLPETRIQSLGERTFIGEIVDSKCSFGVMNPGQLKPHRACAVRCISGGVPPVLLVRQTNNTALYLLLVSRDGRPVNRQVLEMVAEPVRITGELARQGELMVLRSDPATYERIR
jgi:hypothetical protein